MTRPPPRLLSVLFLVLFAPVFCRAAVDSAFERLGPWLVPPPEHAGLRQPLRSLLQFQDGGMVRSAADWGRRKKEIRAEWMEALGAWPEVLAHPRLEVLRETDLPGYTRKRVRVEIAAGRFEEGWLSIPKSAGPHPAVLVPFYEPETSIGLGDKEHRDYARRLAERGFVTLAVGSPGGNARLPEPGREGWQPLSFLAYVSANCANVLANLPEVDAKRLGIVGHSYGGKWALFSACLNEGFACAAWSDPGIGFDELRPSINYWEPWYLGWTAGPPRAPGLPTAQNPATGPYVELRKEGHDLHELQALMAPRPFFVSGGSEDPPRRWGLLNVVREVYTLLGAPDRVGMHNRPAHPPTHEATELVCDFFTHFLGKPPAVER
jgi:hypothetical protein